MKYPLAIVLLTLGLGACDGISFVAVDERPSVENAVAQILVESRHDDGLSAHIHVHYAGFESPVHVTVNGSLAPVEQRGEGRWAHRAQIPVDSLRPVVEVGLDGGSAYGATTVRVPLLTRSGSAQWQPDGDLLLSAVLHPDFPEDWGSFWSLEVADSVGTPLIRLTALTSLPQPLVIDGDLVPPEAHTAEVAMGGSAELSVARYPLGVAVNFTAHIDIPPPGD